MSTPTPTLEHYKLETEFHDGYVLNRAYEWDYSVRRETSMVKWKRGKSLGKGAFGEVWLEEKEEGGMLRAVKCLERNSAVLIETGVTRELLALITLTDYKHLFVELFGWYENTSNIFIAMEYMKDGDLGAYIKHPEQARASAKVVTKQILEALKVIHEVGICHRDLKPQNVLIASLDPIWVKLADFGASKQTKNTALRTRCGTQGYVAPELLGLLPRRFRAGSSQRFSYAIDMWSLGCLLHEMLTSKTPFLQLESDGETEMTGVDFEPETDTAFLYDYCMGDEIFPIELLQASGVSRNGIGLIKGLLTPNPAVRPTAVHTLQHSWLVEDDPEETIIADSGPDSNSGALTPTCYVTKDECFNNFTMFLTREKLRLSIFFDDEALKKSACVAKTMVEGLYRLGCEKEIAMQLSVLVLYDLVMLIESWWPHHDFRPSIRSYHKTGLTLDNTDDSASMESEQQGERIQTLHATISEITTIYDFANPTGINGMEFLNSNVGFKGIQGENWRQYLTSVDYNGVSRIGSALRSKVLRKFVWGTEMTKPLLVVVITDGDPEGERRGVLEETLKNFVKRLNNDPTRGGDAVSIQFARVGNDKGAQALFDEILYSTWAGENIGVLGNLSLERLADPEYKYRWVILPRLLLGAIMSWWKYQGDYLSDLPIDN